MAASIRTLVCFTFGRRSATKTTALWPRISPLSEVRLLSTTNQPEETISEAVSEWESLDEEDIDRIRNVSGLTETQRKKMDHAREVPEMKYIFQESLKYKRRLYAKFGEKSGIDARMAWPTVEEIRKQVVEEKEWEQTLQEMWKEIEDEKRIKESNVKKREAKIEKNMDQMQKWIKEYHGRLEAKAAEKRKQVAKKQKLLEEAREYFGYEVDPKDVKFQQMLDEKELQLKKEKKARKKEHAAAKLASDIQLMVDAASSTKNQTDGSPLESSTPTQENASKGDNPSETDNIDSSSQK